MGEEARILQDRAPRVEDREEGLLAAGLEAHLGDGVPLRHPCEAPPARREAPSSLQTFATCQVTPASTATAIRARLRPESTIGIFLPAPKVCTTIRKIAPMERSPWKNIELRTPWK